MTYRWIDPQAANRPYIWYRQRMEVRRCRPLDLNVPFHEKDDARHSARVGIPCEKRGSCQMTQISHLFTKCCHSNRISTFEPPPILSRNRHACVGTAIEVRRYSVSFFLTDTKNGRLATNLSTGASDFGSDNLLRHVHPLNVQVQMHSITNHYRNDFSKTTQSF